MRLTPLDIKKQDFKRVMRGVDAEEVQAFLQMVADQWQELVDDQKRLEHKITELETKLEHYKQVEEALQEAVKTARESSRQTLDAAKNKAKSIVDAASDSAERLQRKAQESQFDLRRDIDSLRSRRREAITRLRSLLRSELEMLDDFEHQYPIPAEAEPEIQEAPESPRVELDDPDSPSDEALEEAAAVKEIEELDSVSTPDEYLTDEGIHSDDTLVFTAGDDGAEGSLSDDSSFDESTDQSGSVPEAGAQPAGHVAPPQESHRDSTEMDKIRKILDDLA